MRLPIMQPAQLTLSGMSHNLLERWLARILLSCRRAMSSDSEGRGSFMEGELYPSFCPENPRGSGSKNKGRICINEVPSYKYWKVIEAPDSVTTE